MQRIGRATLPPTTPFSRHTPAQKLVKQGANLMAQLRNPQAVASQLVRLCVIRSALHAVCVC